MTQLVNLKNLWSLFAAAFLFFAAVAGCGKVGQLQQVIEGVQELQPKAEERNREIEELSKSAGEKPAT